MIVSLALGAVAGAFVEGATIGPRFDIGPNDISFAPVIGTTLFWVLVVGASLTAIAAALSADKRGWLGVGALAFVASSLIMSRVNPADAGQGPLVATNSTDAAILVAVESIDGSWLLNPGEQLTLIDNRPADIQEAYLTDPATCRGAGVFGLRTSGPLIIAIGVGQVPNVWHLATSAAPATAPTDHGCD